MKFDELAKAFGFESKEQMFKTTEKVVSEWYITKLLDNQWIAWNEKETDKVGCFPTREEAMAFLKKHL